MENCKMFFENITVTSLRIRKENGPSTIFRGVLCVLPQSRPVTSFIYLFYIQKELSALKHF